MQKLWKKLAVTVAAVCLAVGGGLCIVGCDGGTSGTSYQYKPSSGSYTDTYILYEDGTYERTYEGDPYVGTPALEIGTYKTDGSKITFTGKSAWGEGSQWPSGVSLSRLDLPTYTGTLTTNLVAHGITYTKHGSVHTSK